MKKFALGLILLQLSFPAFAQDTTVTEKDRQYVTDQLRLSLYEGPNSQSKVVKLLISGDALEIEEIRGPYALVTTTDGLRGWVKRGFLVANPTSNLQLREEQRKNVELLEEIDKLSNSKAVIDTYENDMDAMTEKMREVEYKHEQAVKTIAELEEQLASKQQELELKMENNEPPLRVLRDTFRSYWQILVPFLLALLLLCFLVSKTIVEWRIKSKFHGIKIW
jgi:SH3 domain protein